MYVCMYVCMYVWGVRMCVCVLAYRSNPTKESSKGNSVEENKVVSKVNQVSYLHLEPPYLQLSLWNQYKTECETDLVVSVF